MVDNYPRDILRECKHCVAFPIRNTAYCLDCHIKMRSLTDDRLIDVEIRLAMAEGGLDRLASIVGTLTGSDDGG